MIHLNFFRRPAQDHPAQAGNLEGLFFVALIVIHLAPVWAFKHFPSQDGPAHLHIADVLIEYQRPDHAIFRDYYAINVAPLPNWFIYPILAGLMRLVPALVAEKILLSIYIILLPISAHYALRAVRTDAGFLAVLSFPFIYNYLFHMGFYNFSCSLPMFFFLIGCWWKYQDEFAIRYALALVVVSILTYFCHLVSMVTAYVAIAVLTLWLVAWDMAHVCREDQSRLKVLWTIFRTRVVVPLFALTPGFILAAAFLVQNVAYTGTQPVKELVQGIHNLHVLVSYDQREIVFTTVLADVFICLLAYFLVSKTVHCQVTRKDGFLLVVIVYICLYFAAPGEIAGGGFVNDRLSLYPFMALMIWFAAQAHPKIIRWSTQIIAIVVSVALLGLHVVKYAELTSYIEEYLSGTDLIRPNTTLLSLSFSHRGHDPGGRALSQRVEPFPHLDGYIAVQKHLVLMNNYHAATGQFPIVFRPALDPFVHIGIENKIGAQPPWVDFVTYPQRTGGQVDYVLVWQPRNDQSAQSIFRQLEAQYELVYTSPRGFVLLYRRI